MNEIKIYSREECWRRGFIRKQVENLEDYEHKEKLRQLTLLDLRLREEEVAGKVWCMKRCIS